MGIFNNIEPNQLYQMLIVVMRVTSIILFIPFLGSRSIPVRLKIGFAILVSIIVYPFVDFTSIIIPTRTIPLAMTIAGEVLIGVVIGYAARLFFVAIQMSGYLIGFQIGFGVVNVIDPQTSTQISIIANLENIVAMLFFITINAHHIFLKAISDSFVIIPPLGASFSPNIILIISRLFADVFSLSVRICAPVLAAIIFTHVALGLVARSVPQINVFIVGLPLQIWIGLFMIGISITFFGEIMRPIIYQMNSSMYLLLRAM